MPAGGHKARPYSLNHCGHSSARKGAICSGKPQEFRPYPFAGFWGAAMG
jgi:hypothetical protein